MSEATIKSGHDHYWNFHANEKEWAKSGCPVCQSKQGQGGNSSTGVSPNTE